MPLVGVKRARNPITRIIFSRFFVIFILVVFEFYLIIKLGSLVQNNDYFMPIVTIINFLVAVAIVNRKNQKNEYKIIWLLLMTAMPGSGFIVYILLNGDGTLFNRDKTVKKNMEATKKYVSQNSKYISDFKSKTSDNEKDFINLFYNNGFEPYANNKLTYFDTGEKYFDALIKELKKAKKFILMEYCIINNGKLWNDILDVLNKKADEGVRIFVMYDGLNNALSFDAKYFINLEKSGIHSKMFEPLIPFLTSTQNNRDHRKITVIDNEVAFVGGVNIGDEYANLYRKFGYWKDSGLMIKSDGVVAITAQYLQIYNLSLRKNRRLNIDKYLKCNNNIYGKKINKKINKDESYIVPICDYPHWRIHIHELMYKSMINSAKYEVIITTPYLILDNEMRECIKIASMRGVKVKIIVPKVPDKHFAYTLTRSHFKEFMDAGVEIYLYTPGFMHMKSCTVDKMRTYVGSCNFDYRSLYLHYENGVYIYKGKVLNDILKDLNKVLKVSKKVRFDDVKNFPLYEKFLCPLMKMLAPLW